MLKLRAITRVWLVCACLGILSCGLNKLSKSPAEASGESHGGDAPKQSIVQKIKAYDHLPVGDRIALYHQLKKENPGEYNFENEDELTMYGYTMLWNRQLKDAIEIFKLIVQEFPHSANAYDSLGEAYLQAGEKELALANYETSLAMNPDNFVAEDQIERIRYPEKAMEKPGERFVKVFSPTAYREDLDQLAETLLKVHPNALKFITETDFRKVVAQKKALITEKTTYGEFMWHCSEIVASVHCSHTDISRFFVENELLPHALRFPILTRVVDQRLYVIDPLNNTGKIQVKEEIVSINGVAVDKLLADIYLHIPAQGYIQTTQGHVFNMRSTMLIPYALGFPETYTLMLKGSDRPVTLNKAEGYINPPGNPIYPCLDELCLEFSDDAQTAVMSITTFNYYPFDRFDVFKEFVDKSMAELQDKGVKNLILDLRWNGGGSQVASIHLLRYLARKPFVYFSRVEFEGKSGKIEGEEVIAPFENRYKGKLYVMIDGLGNSTTGHFMSLVKVLKLGTIVGEELGSNQFCSAGQKVCRLRHTKLEYYVANNTHVSSATSLPDERGILPDHYVAQSIEDYLSQTDRVKDYTLQLAKQKK